MWLCFCNTNLKKYLLPFTNHSSNASILIADPWICISEGFLSLKLDAAALFALSLFLPKSPGSIPPFLPCFSSALPLPLSNLSHFFQRLQLSLSQGGDFILVFNPLTILCDHSQHRNMWLHPWMSHSWWSSQNDHYDFCLSQTWPHCNLPHKSSASMEKYWLLNSDHFLESADTTTYRQV